MNKQADTSYSKSESTIDLHMFVPSLVVILMGALALIFFPEQTSNYARITMAFVTETIGSIYLLIGVAALIFSIWLAFGPYGNVKLGAPDEGPEYSLISWFSMMFTVGIGAALIAWGFAEPVYYMQTPPLGIEPHSNKAMVWGHMYTLHHWGIIAWNMYALPSVPIAYMLYVRKMPFLRISSACSTALPHYGRKHIEILIDILSIFCIISITATALGFGVPLVSTLVAELFNIPDTFTIKLIVLIIWISLFSTSVYRGLQRGIKILAELNIVLAIVVSLLVLLIGPTIFILSLTTNSLGLMINNLALIALWTDPIDKSGFPESWTIFYWAWWLAYIIVVSLFIGRISRGRTIRQLLLGVTCLGSLGSWVFLSIIGAYSIHLEINDLLPVSDILANEGMSVLITKIIASMPLGKFMLMVFIILALIFYATNIDSSTYILASICSKSSRGYQEPRLFDRLTWIVIIAMLTVGLLISDSLPAIQAATVASSLLLIPIILLMYISMLRWLRQDFGQQTK